ncbi:MAG: hypothetical protein JO053_01660 [Acidobacteria bacterium]|nr:hypothetical protein [Acidobacteriota bacterium]
MIAAGALGLIALIALYLAFGRSLFGGSTTTATVRSTPTPKPATSAARTNTELPSLDEQTLTYETTPVDCCNGFGAAPDPGRNIFAFYEPPPPTPYSPTPTPTPPPVKPPTPAPTPPVQIAFVNPQTVYAGAQGFRLEVNGDKFTPDAHIYFNQVEMPTTFINSQRMITDVPSNLIAQQGMAQIMVQTPDGKTYSNAYSFSVQPPPKPNVQYIGMITKKRGNNDTAYFIDPTRGANAMPFGARLNDVINGRFRLIDMSASGVLFEDVSLGFRHQVAISKPSAGGGSGGAPNGFQPFDPSRFTPGTIPGIPGNVQVVTPGQPPRRPPTPAQDVDDDDGGPDE